jgi:Insertion element 4 transposase N-terminal/Transposase DDE domain
MLDLAAELKAFDLSEERLRALERIIPIDLVQEVLDQTGHSRRHYKTLPPCFVVWLVLGLGLFAQDSYADVFKRLQRFRKGGTPHRNTIGSARKGLGCAVMRLLARRVVRLLGQPDTPHCFYKGHRLMALDSFLLDLPDSPANARVFGYPKGKKGQGAFPQARVLALCETGTHVVFRHLIKPGQRGEIGMAATLLRHVTAGMLVLWDRNLFSYKALKLLCDRKAHLLCRLKQPVLTEAFFTLPDGSYLAKAYATPKDRRHDEGGLVVRVIEYTLEDPGRPIKGENKVHRLLTTLLEPKEHPAEDLIVLYHERWEEELTIDEIKTHQRERPVLRSETPWGVVQEIEGLLLAHYVVRAVMAEAAGSAGVAPRQLSFVGALKVLRNRLPEVTPSKAGRKRWWQDLLAEVGERVLPPRRERINPRVMRRPGGFWPKKREQHRQHPQPTMPFRDSIRLC